MSRRHHSKSRCPDPRQMDPFQRIVDDDVERWLPYPYAEGYDISDHGRVRSWIQGGPSPYRKEPKILKPYRNHKACHVIIYVRNKHSRKSRPITRVIHRLVLETFIGSRPDKMECRHLDGNPHNNRLDNLIWGSALENAADRFRHGSVKPRKHQTADRFFDPFIPLEAIIPWEVWKACPFANGYDVSNKGNVRSYWTRGCESKIGKNPRKVKGWLQKPGYPFVAVRLNSDRSRKTKIGIHRLVLETFSPKPRPDLECRHLDGSYSNARLDNLRWGTRQENRDDDIRLGRTTKGELDYSAKLTEIQVKEIKRRLANGERQGDLAREFGVHSATIFDIFHEITWKHVI